jgi:hypothetical protein
VIARRIQSGQLSVVEDGRRFVFGHGCPQATVVVRSPKLWPTPARSRNDISRHYELGYEERFQRLSRLYLCFCEAGFAERRISDVQIVLAKPEPLEQPAAVAPAPSRGAVARAGSSRVTVE